MESKQLWVLCSVSFEEDEGHQDIKITRSYYATLQESTVIREVTQAFK